jgi:replicative DNA helicase
MNVEHYADLVLDKSRRRQARAAAECLVQKQAANQGLIGMPTGLQSLDLATGGIRPGELWTIGALPGKGKTALGVQVLLANGAAGVPCVAFSLEMQTLEIGKRFLAAKSAVPAMQVRNPQTIRNERWTELLEAAAKVAECPIYVDDRSTLRIQELLASARLYIRRYGVKLIVVDYLRLVESPGRDLNSPPPAARKSRGATPSA